ncbi:MAG: hypothetical protein OXB86_05670 [Bdellovibrionales bacterium]|nr:hypothetical protein [Bdellovibrionales bacterium]
MLRPILAILFAAAIAVVVYVIGCSHTTYIDTEAVCEAVESRPGGICRPPELSSEPFVPDPEEFPPEPEDPRGPDDPPRDPRDRPEPSPRREFVETVYPVELGEVRIVLAIDNSSSMSREHRNMGEQLRPFLNHIRHLKYRLAIITTDISSSPNNPARGEDYQDGNFILIGGKKWLENERVGQSPSSATVDAFIKAVERPETQACDEARNQPSNGGGGLSACEQCIQQHGEGPHCETQCSGSSGSSSREACPSGHERAIHAFNLSIEKNPDFYEGIDAHIVFAVLSDEDNCSSTDPDDQPTEECLMEEKDQLTTLVDTVYHRLGHFRTFSHHAIIVPPPSYSGGEACFDEQNRDRRAGGRAYYGREYARLAEAEDEELTKYGNLIEGKVISICDRAYARQLGQIAAYVDVPRVSIPCKNPHRVRFFQGGQKLDLGYEVENGRSLVVTSNVSIGGGSQMEIHVICEKK